MKAKVAIAGVAVLSSAGAFGAMTHAQAAVIAIPAPASVATAVAVKVGDLASVGDTGAQAGANGSSASAKPVAIGDTPLLTGVKSVTSSAAGALIDTGETQLGRVAVAPWQTTVNGNQASSSAALATAKLNGVGDIAVAPSSSYAMWTPAASISNAISDGAVIHLGDQTIKILHSESKASGGLTYLVQIFGKNIGSVDSNGCLLDVGPVANVGCLAVLRGAGVDAAVAQALIGDDAPLAKVVAAAANGGKGTVAAASASVAGQTVSREAPRSLPRTGMNLLASVAFGLLMAVAGATLLRQSKTPATLPARVR